VRRVRRIASRRTHGGCLTLSCAFIEHGELILANVLRSGRAVEINILVVRAFVRLREVLNSAVNSPGSRQIDFTDDPKKQTSDSGDHSGIRLDWPHART
jgi:hypothetical protein